MPFEKGNTYGKGRPRVPEIEMLRKALRKFKRQEGVDFIEFCVMQCKENPIMAGQILKKILPDLQTIKGELTGDLIIKIIDRFGDDSTKRNNDPV